MKRFWLLILVFPMKVQASDLWLKVGEVRSLPAATGKSVRIGSRGVIKVIDGDSSVRVVALKPGITPLIIGEQNFSVHVSLSQQKEFTFAMREAIGQMMGLKLNLDMQPITVSGTLLRFSDWEHLAELSRQYQGEYIFKAHALEDVAEEAINTLSTLARSKGLPVVRFLADPEFVAQIPAAAGSLKESASKLFKPYGIQVSAPDSQLMLQPLVRTRVILAEVSKDKATEFGIQWPGDYTAQVLPDWKPSADGVVATLKAMETKGQAQVLASPNLLCRSGSEAKFHAGGSFPIKLYSRFNHDVIWKEHGVLLSVKPVADFNGAISLEIETEISTLDAANSVEGIPALKTNTVHSHFDLPGKRTVALSGLLRKELGEGSDGLPLLSSIPILGALFSSQRFMKHLSELVIFVTPEIYVPDSDEKVEMPKGWVRDAI